MINSRTPFLNPDGTVSREWYLFLTTLNAVANNPTSPGATSINDIRRVAEEEGPLVVPSMPLVLDARKADEGRPFIPPTTSDIGARKADEGRPYAPPLLADIGARKVAESVAIPPPIFIPLNQSKVLATTTNAQSIPNNAFTTVTTWTTSLNRGNNFNASTGVYTCPVTGLYDVRSAIRFASTTWTGGNVAALAVFVNGAEIFSNSVSVATNAILTLQVFGAFWVSCNAGDQITVQVFQNTGGAVALNGVNVTNWLNIEQLP